MDGHLILGVVVGNGVGHFAVVLVDACAQKGFWIAGRCRSTAHAVLYKYEVALKADAQVIYFAAAFFGEAPQSAEAATRAARTTTHPEATATGAHRALHLLGEALQLGVVLIGGEAGEFWGFHRLVDRPLII